MPTISEISFEGFMRLKQVLRVIPVSRSTWYMGVKEGKYPKPIKLGPRSVAWRACDIVALVKELSSQDAQ